MGFLSPLDRMVAQQKLQQQQQKAAAHAQKVKDRHKGKTRDDARPSVPEQNQKKTTDPAVASDGKTIDSAAAATAATDGESSTKERKDKKEKKRDKDKKDPTEKKQRSHKTAAAPDEICSIAGCGLVVAFSGAKACAEHKCSARKCPEPRFAANEAASKDYCARDCAFRKTNREKKRRKKFHEGGTQLGSAAPSTDPNRTAPAADSAKPLGDGANAATAPQQDGAAAAAEALRTVVDAPVPESEKEHEVEAILDMQPAVDGSQLFLVQWKEPGKEGSKTWEPEANLTGCPELIQQFHDERKNASRIKIKVSSRPRAPTRPRPQVSRAKSI